MAKSATSFKPGHKKLPGAGWKPEKPTVGDMLRRLMLYREHGSDISPVEMGFAHIIDNVAEYPKEFLTLAKMAFKELRDDFKVDVGFSDEFKRLITDREGVELAKQLSRRIQPGVGVTGSNGDAPGPGLAAAAAPGPA